MLKTRTCRDEAKRLFMPRTTMACVTSIIATMRDIYHRSRRKEKIEMHTGYDADTGLPNRNLLMDRLNQLLSHDSRHNRAAAVICLGVDGLEGIACALGLDGGIEVLPNLVGELAQFLRHTDTMARLHRDELVIVLGGNLREADIDLAVSKVELILARPIRIPTGEITISASLGIACFPSDGLTAESLIQRAHFAMNRARESSDGFQYYCSYMTVKAMERLRFESVMICSLEAGEFSLRYQPKYAGDGRKVIGMEALIRWRHHGEIIPPERFLAEAEENGMIVKLGEWAIKEACRQNKHWQREGLPSLQVSVNVSARQLCESDLAERIQVILREAELAPEFLELEIAESAIPSIADTLVRKLAGLKEQGVGICVDNFGAGRLSLTCLKNLPVDGVKIGRSLVMDIGMDPCHAAIVGAIVSIARAHDLRVIASGVESKGQLDFLVDSKCAQFQGSYFSKPLNAEHFADLLRSGATTTVGRPATLSEHSCRLAHLPENAISPPPFLHLVGVKSGVIIPCVQLMDVVHPIQPVLPGSRILDVLSRFQMDKDLKVLPVVEDKALVGIVNRSTFLEEHILGKYGFAAHINHAKKIGDLMEPPMVAFDAATSVEEAAKILQPIIGALCIDNICITRNGAYAGMIDVNRFIKAMSDVNHFVKAMADSQILLARGANPLTGLPGNTSIERTICERLNSDVPFDIAYFDIDNFKPFNDHYGFQMGDEIIKKLAEVMAASVASSPVAATSFCGHIGGDDFILITEYMQAEKISAQIVAAFEREQLAFHGPKDHAKGGYSAVNRKGKLESFSLISLSVGIVNTSHSLVGSYARLASLSTEVKKAAKKKNGSSIVVDRRTAQYELGTDIWHRVA